MDPNGDRNKTQQDRTQVDVERVNDSHQTASEAILSMYTHPALADRRQVLVCLSNPRGLLLVNEILTREGFAVTTACTLGEFERAMRLGGFSVVVTATEAIDAIQQITGLPVVNIRASIREWADEHTGDRSCLFDRAAFVDELRSALGCGLVGPGISR